MVLNIHGLEVRDLVFHRISRLIPITDDELIIPPSPLTHLMVPRGATKGFLAALLSFHGSGPSAGRIHTHSLSGFFFNAGLFRELIVSV